MPDARHIRTMLYLGEDVVGGARACHYQVANVDKEMTYGFIGPSGTISYGYASIAESKRAFRASLDHDFEQEIANVV